MATTLVSPGVSVEVNDESFYASNGPGTVPFILIASQQDKLNPSGTIAAGTKKANAGKVYSIGSRRELLNTFGTPVFPKTSSGSASYGSEIAEYGLLAAHSVLDITSRAYVMRADIDLSQLIPSTNRPAGHVLGGTLYLDSVTSQWGVFEFSATTGAFTNKKPLVITSSSDLNGGAPKSTLGTVGTYAVVAVNNQNPVYYKTASVAGNTSLSGWVPVGGNDWQKVWPTISGTNINPVVSAGDKVTINGVTVTFSGSTIASAAADINATGTPSSHSPAVAIPGVKASAATGYLKIYVDKTAKSDGTNVDGKLIISLPQSPGDTWSRTGVGVGTYAPPTVQMSPHTQVPTWRDYDATPKPTGSVWIKTTAVSAGANLNVYRYSSTAVAWQLQAVPLYYTDIEANAKLDPTRGGLGIPYNTLYAQYNLNQDSSITYRILARATTGTTAVTGDNTVPVFSVGASFQIQASVTGGTTMPVATTITMTGTTASSFVADVLAANVTNVSARLSSNGAVVIEHTTGGTMYLIDGVSNPPLAAAGISVNSYNVRPLGQTSTFIVSNWHQAIYTVQASPPIASPVNGSLWYPRSPISVDIMINDGTNWRGYKGLSRDARGYDLTQSDPNGVIISASKPIAQSNGNALQYGDLWLDTGNLENYPSLYRWQNVLGDQTWVAIDNTDSSHENGITFADARWDTDGTTDPGLDALPSIVSLLTSDYLDLDAPDPLVYPRGCLLFNTRRSSYNVKQYVTNKWNPTDYPLQLYPDKTDTWISVSGANSKGVPHFGRKAQRSVIVAALRGAIDTSADIREDSRFFNLICCPAYPELTQNMVELNTARRQTAFVIADLPMGLSSDQTVLENYITNTSGVANDTEDGFVTNDPFVATFYPSAGLTNDTTGATVAVPASHMMLRTIIKSDNTAFPWFAPAGEQRGAVDNATAIGYVDRTSGAFISIGTQQSLRDLLYVNRVNPIAVFAGSGILNYGQKTRATSSTALDRINVARLINYIRYQLEKITKPLIFQPNDKITRNEAKQAVESMLNDVLTNRGLYDYLVVCDETNNTPDRIDRNELHIDIAIEPTKAVEFVYIPVRLLTTGSIAAGNLAQVQPLA